MKLIEGGNLAEQLGSFQDDPRAAVSLMIEMAEAIQHAHMRGILHRDLKPANILIDAKGHPHITDFGLAKRVGADVEMTASGAIMGTPAYMSPEQASGRRGAMTTATDVYGLGAIFYALLTGKAPFGGESVIETLDAVRTRPPESPTKRNARIPRDLELICLKCLEKDPADALFGRGAGGRPGAIRGRRAGERARGRDRRAGGEVGTAKADPGRRVCPRAADAALRRAGRRGSLAVARPRRRPARRSPGSSTAGRWKWPTRSGGRTTSPPP